MFDDDDEGGTEEMCLMKIRVGNENTNVVQWMDGGLKKGSL